MGVIKRILTGLTIAAVVVAAVLFAPIAAFPWVTGVLLVLAMMEFLTLLNRKRAEISVRRFQLIAACGLLILVFGLWAIPTIAGKYGNLMLLYILMMVKFSDTGGFAFGLTSAKLMKGGNHKLCPTISPNKSWEGLLGSLVFSSAVSFAFMPVTHFPLLKALLLGVVAALVGTAGDLVESKFKRWVGVKDSSTLKLTNGMGGVLDMLDSLLFAPAILACLI